MVHIKKNLKKKRKEKNLALYSIWKGHTNEIIIFTYIFFGRVGSSLLCVGFL